MIAVDSSTLIAFLAGDEGRDVDWLDQALALQQAVLPPVVLTEMLSAPTLDRDAADLLRGLAAARCPRGILGARRRDPRADSGETATGAPG